MFHIWRCKLKKRMLFSRSYTYWKLKTKWKNFISKESLSINKYIHNFNSGQMAGPPSNTVNRILEWHKTLKLTFLQLNCRYHYKGRYETGFFMLKGKNQQELSQNLRHKVCLFLTFPFKYISLTFKLRISNFLPAFFV